MSCGKCYNCEESHPAYCINAFSCNFEGERGIYTLSDRDDCTIGGAFFGQSSFASQAIAKERCLVNLQGLDLSPEEMQILAPLGCGIQTGCGAFLNIADVQPTQTVAVLGVGGVGQSAIMVGSFFLVARRICSNQVALLMKYSFIGSGITRM
jgi:Zn-dependent alcohol dehydrogenase